MQKNPRFSILIVVIIAVLASIPMMSAKADDSFNLAHEAPTPVPAETFIQAENPYFTTEEIPLLDGRQLERQIINSPPHPPETYLVQRTAVTSLSRSATILPDFPSYSWVFGCSAVSGAMIAGYYDRNGYPDLYTGGTNGGVMPLTDSGWPEWTDGNDDKYPANPLVASQLGLDGRTAWGSIEDYWVGYASTASDPYISGSWSQHMWGSDIGDFMKTSQSLYHNIDGGTSFWLWNEQAKMTCEEMSEALTDKKIPISEFDGTFGRKLFYEARGYHVDECYNERTNNIVSNGFSFADFQAEIDSGHPVLVNLTNHSVVGFGYDDQNNIIVRDTWDSNPDNNYTMPWGGCLPTDTNGCLGLQSVSVVKPLIPVISRPGVFEKKLPENMSYDNPNPVLLSWTGSTGADRYEICFFDSDVGNCDKWADNGNSTSKLFSGLKDGTTYFWQVRAVNDGGYTYADGSPDAFWQFSTDIDPPGDFSKVSPGDGDSALNDPVTLTWNPSTNASYYQVCYGASEVACTNWLGVGDTTSYVLAGLDELTTYYWQVRAVNIEDTTYADASSADNYWVFTTGKLGQQIFLPMIIQD